MRRHQQRWDVEGLDTCAYDTGPHHARPTLVMVHGGDVRSLSNARDWTTVWDPEALGCRLIAYDKPGQGLSYAPDLPPWSMTAPGQSQHLRAVVDRSAAGSVILVGHSRGALPVADVALSNPEMVSGVVLVSSNTLAPVSGQTPADFYPRAYADPPATPGEEYVRRELDMNSHSREHIDRAIVDHRLRVATHRGWWDDRDKRDALYEQTILPSIRELQDSVLARVRRHGFTMPVMVVWGREDVSAPLALGHALYDAIAAVTPECWAVTVNRAAHYVYRERAEQFTGVVRAFVDHCLRHVAPR